jgi:mannosyltransferase OCH1-like enzyme
MIPKTIHYCWFGNKAMPKEQQAYINGWKKLMPDYKFKCWSEKDFDANTVAFTKEAYEAGKLAFVADYVRVYALVHEGGIYMDTDVKLKSSLEPFRKKHRVFTSYEFNTSRSEMELYRSRVDENWDRRDKSILKVPGNGMLSALVGAEPNHPFLKDLLDYYNSIHFQYAMDNRLTIPTTLALMGEKYGFKYHNVEQELAEGIHIYDSSVFSDFYNVTPNTVAIHFCDGSWVKKSMLGKIKSKLYRIAWLKTLVLTLWKK